MIKTKNILLVSSAFYPEISPRSYRATELAIEFCRQGHSVKVISKYRNFNYSGFLKDNNITINMWGKSKFPKIPIYRHKFLFLLSRVFSRLLSMIFEYPDIEEMFQVRRILKDEGGYDLLISFAVPYPVHWGVAWARTKKHPIADVWVADCGDPYMGDVIDTFRKLFYFSYLEKWFCRKTDFIAIPIEGARAGYYTEFHNKIRIIPQGFNFELHTMEESRQDSSIPRFAYAGGFIRNVRDPDLLLQYLIKIDLPFEFYIYTNQPEFVIPYMSSLMNKLFISEYIPRNDLMKVLRKMDFLINFDNHTSRNSPSKLIDYAISNRPVLNIDKSFKFEDLMAFLKKDYTNRMLLPKPESFHITHVSGLFLDLLKR